MMIFGVDRDFVVTLENFHENYSQNQFKVIALEIKRNE